MKLKNAVCSNCDSDLDGIKLSVGDYCPRCGEVIEKIEW